MRREFEVRRGPAGVPWVAADDELALAFGQGWVTATDRAWQLTCDRWHARGEVAEHLGSAAGEWDRFARENDLLGTATRAVEALDAATAAWLQAYADGVTAGFDDLRSGPRSRYPSELTATGAELPSRWSPVDSAAVFWVQHVLLGSWGHELWRAHVQEVAATDAVVARCLPALVGAPVGCSGSNAVGVAGGLTATGRPVIAADPHRVLEIPGVYQQIGLVLRGHDGFDAAGLAFPGVPGLPHFGHNGRVAWAVTHAMAVSETVTTDGRVMSAADLSTRGHDPAALGLDVMRAMLSARSARDVRAATARWVAPVNSWLVADAGVLLEGVAGCLLRRSSGSGSGGGREFSASGRPESSDHERHLPESTLSAGSPQVVRVDRWAEVEGVVVHANDRRAATEDLGPAHAPAHRAVRLRELVTALVAGDHEGVTAARLAATLTDTHLSADALVPQLVAPGPSGHRSGGGLDMAADSVAAGRYARLRDAVAVRLAGSALAAIDTATQATREAVERYPGLVRPWLDAADRIAHALPRLAREAPEIVDGACTDLGTVVAEPWGSRHRAWPVHPLGPDHLAAHGVSTLPTGGDAETVASTSTTPWSDGRYSRAAVARVAWDLGCRDSGGWVVPFGADGEPAAPHGQDQHPLWARGELVPLTNPFALTEDS